jgi:hypothetical protein
MKKSRIAAFILLPLFICTQGACKKKEFSIVGYWEIYWNGSPTAVRYEFSGTPVAGTVVEVGALPAYQNHSYAVNGIQVTLSFYNFHGIGWSRRTCSGTMDEAEESMAGTYVGQIGGTPVVDTSGTWFAVKIQ